MFGEIRKLRPAKIGYIRLQSEYSGEAFDSPKGREIEEGIIGMLKDKGAEIKRIEKPVF